MRKKTRVYTYRESVHSKHGIAAAIIAAVSMCLFLLLTWLSIRTGKTTPVMGAVGLCGFVIALYGTYLGLHSFRDACRSFFFSKVGTLWCGLMTAIWFLIICVGLAS